MLLIPSIEVQDGRCAVGSQAPREARSLAALLVAAGARRIQIVDHDAAAGRATSAAAVAQAIAACDGVPVQLSGGMRDEESVQRALDAGAQFVVLDPRVALVQHLVQDLCLEFPTHLLIALEARAGRLALEGNWSKLHHHTALEVALQFQREGVVGVIHHDRGAAGEVAGPSLGATAEFARGLAVPVIAAGGVATAAELAALAISADDGVEGALLAPDLLASETALRALFAAA